MVRKRAPGGGRRPKGPHRGNTESFSVRVRPEVRTALEREAKRNRVSLAQEIQTRLTASLDGGGRKRTDKLFGWTADEIDRNRSLASLLGQLAARVESSTDESWRSDRYTFEALCAAIAMLLDRLAPQSAVALPSRVSELIARVGQPIGEQLEQPSGTAAMVALGLWSQLVSTELPPSDHPKTTHYAEEFYVLPAIRKALGLERE